MKDRKKIKIAMVGTGFAANIHGEAYEKVPGVDVQVVAVASKIKEQAIDFCKKFHIDESNIYEDANKMIEEIDADIIDLVVPTFLHVPFAIKAAKEGKNIIC
ncbi:MAG: Gfo/Idh/MocA family protein, partial [Promethearchaeota archaeon]